MKEVLFKKEWARHVSYQYSDRNSIVDDLDYIYGVKHTTPPFSLIKVLYDEKTFNENLKNIFFGVTEFKVTIVIEEEGSKVSLKMFYKTFHRDVGYSWFRQSKNLAFFTVDREKGDVYVGELINYQKKRKVVKKLRRNFFMSTPFSTILARIKNTLNFEDLNSSEISNVVGEIFLRNVVPNPTGLTRDAEIFKFYLDKKGIKYPNNFWLYSKLLYGREIKKILSKNDKRLVDSVMKQYSLKGKKIKTALHNSEYINIEFLKSMIDCFGEDWITQNNRALKNIIEYRGNFHFRVPILEYMSREEKKRVFNLIVNYVCTGELNEFTFNDHINMYNSLKEYGHENLRWLSETIEGNTFHNEHLDWTAEISYYRKGDYVRIYSEDFIKSIELPIDDYYPILLTNTTEYVDESMIQQNCVRTYIGRPSSYIISLRKGNRDSNERGTIEYRIKKKDDNILAERVQYLGRFNDKLDDSWNDVLLKLDDRVLSLLNNQNFDTVKLTKTCLNGKVLSTDSHFNEMGILSWVDKNSITDYFPWEI